MRITTQIWLGMSILLTGYVSTVINNDTQTRQSEAFLGRLDRSMVPAIHATQTAMLTFKQMTLNYEDGVVTGDLEELAKATPNGQAVVEALRQFDILSDISPSRQEDARLLATRLTEFQAEANVVYRRLATTPTAIDMKERAANLKHQTGELRDSLAKLADFMREDLSLAIKEHQRSTAFLRQISNIMLISIMVFAIIGAMALTIRWTSRLAALMRASTRLSEGDYETRVEVVGTDEAGSLGSRFEHMRLAISERDLSLRVFNDTLEQQIHDRTRELEDRNRTLSTEIAERQRAEKNLRIAHEETEAMFGSLGAALIGLDADDRVTRWNSASEILFDRTAEATIGLTLAETGIRCDWVELFLAVNRCINEKKTIEIAELRYEDLRNELRWLSLLVSPSRDQDGSRPGRGRVVLLVTDITQRRLEESQRNQSAKMESIGQLAAGIAHEINTPIQFIGDNLRFLADAHGSLKTLRDAHRKVLAALRPTAPTELLAYVDGLEAQCDLAYLDVEVPRAISQSMEGTLRVSEIVKAMKSFSHPNQGDLSPLDLNEALRTTITVARNEYKYVADVVMDLDPTLPMVPCHQGSIHQVFLNLLVNAAHAIADVVADSGKRGTITIQTKHDGNHAAISITDTGTGIPDAVQPKLFTPFFTTKAVGKGTGQGLNFTHTIVVKQHRGQITFHTAVGHGTTFIVRLPLPS